MVFKVGKTKFTNEGPIVTEKDTGEKLKLTASKEENILTDEYGRDWKISGKGTLELITA